MNPDESPFDKPELDYVSDPGWWGVALAAAFAFILLGVFVVIV